MDLLSVFKRKTPLAGREAPEAADAVQLARTRARQRLIGAAVLVVAGIIAFPLLFETQPRPIPVDLPIDIPRKDNAPPLAMPTPPAAPAASATVAAKPAAPVPRVITETEADAGKEVAPAASAAATPASAVVAEPAPKAKAPVSPTAKASAPPAAAIDAARAQALLEGKQGPGTEASAPTSGAARFVVQVGAFADPVALKEARAKVEKLGLKTYTQVAETPAGPRTRVRVGPFETRAEAERAAAKIKAGAMPAAILSL